MKIKAREINIDCIFKLFKLEIKELFFMCYYNLVLQNETFYMVCQWLFLDFIYKAGFKQIDTGMFVEIILQRLYYAIS